VSTSESAAAEPIAEPAATLEPTDELPGLGVSVVLAEDESIIRLDLSETLSAMGFQVIGETGRGDEAEELVRRLSPDVAILDVKMPGRTGIEVAEALCEDRFCAVVVLSAFSQRKLVEDAAQAGVMAYLLKPYQRAELATAINVARVRHDDMRKLAGEVKDLEQRLADRKLYDRAKGRLIDEYGQSEAAAMKYIQKHAMDKRVPARDVAQQIIDGALIPGSP